MNGSKVPVLESVLNSISQPNDHDNAIAFNIYFANVGFEISKHLGAENEPKFKDVNTRCFCLKLQRRKLKW